MPTEKVQILKDFERGSLVLAGIALLATVVMIVLVCWKPNEIGMFGRIIVYGGVFGFGLGLGAACGVKVSLEELGE